MPVCQNAARKSLWFTACFDNSKSGASSSHKPVLMEKKLVFLARKPAVEGGQ